MRKMVPKRIMNAPMGAAAFSRVRVSTERPEKNSKN
jgi:hypothetical protein